MDETEQPTYRIGDRVTHADDDLSGFEGTVIDVGPDGWLTIRWDERTHHPDDIRHADE